VGKFIRKHRFILEAAIAAPLLIAFQNCAKSNNIDPTDMASMVPFKWTVNGWGSCSAKCGGGTQDRLYVCTDYHGNVVDDTFCPNPKPTQSQTCNTQTCGPYIWVEGGFGACSAVCNGTQSETVTCRDSTGAVAANSLCTAPPPPSVRSCNMPQCFATQPIYASYAAQIADLLLSLDPNEGPNAGYTPEGTPFSLFQNSSSTRVVVYRCYYLVGGAFGNHFASTSSACEGQTVEGPLGYAESQSVSTATRPVYRCVSPQGYHYEATDSATCTNMGYSVEYVLGYVP
jgi:hypothetical protein